MIGPNPSWHYLFLSLLQGITEFVPISASGHLTLARALLGLDSGRDLAVVATAHAGTLGALLATHGKDFGRLVSSNSPFRQAELRAVMFTTITTAVIYFSAGDFFANLFAAPTFVGIGLVFTAFILVYAELRRPETVRALRHTRFTDWMLVGILQAISLIPGGSRMAATISGGLLIGLDRKESVRFALLLGVPAIIWALVAALALGNLPALFGATPYLAASVLLLSFASGWLAIRFIVSYVPRHRLDPFAIYCLVLGVFAVVVAN
ncbi:undecaprenyl-diphosphate phosphatase [bacterium]|nr:undecaprenyl-diphosphate phosphatase [bacterium]